MTLLLLLLLLPKFFFSFICFLFFFLFFFFIIIIIILIVSSQVFFCYDYPISCKFLTTSDIFRTESILLTCLVLIPQFFRREDFARALLDQPRPRFAPLLKKLRLQGYDPARGGRREASKIAVIFVDDVLQSR